MLKRPTLPVPITLAVAIAAGLLIGLGMAPMGVWPATIVGFALFVWLMAGLRMRAGFGWGYLAGLALNTLTISWVSVLGFWVGVALVAFMSRWWAVLGLVLDDEDEVVDAVDQLLGKLAERLLDQELERFGGDLHPESLSGRRRVFGRSRRDLAQCPLHLLRPCPLTRAGESLRFAPRVPHTQQRVHPLACGRRHLE